MKNLDPANLVSVQLPDGKWYDVKARSTPTVEEVVMNGHELGPCLIFRYSQPCSKAGALGKPMVIPLNSIRGLSYRQA